MKKPAVFLMLLIFALLNPGDLFAQFISEIEPNNDLLNNLNPVIKSDGRYYGAVPWSTNDIDIWRIKPGSSGTLSFFLLLPPDGSQMIRGLYESTSPSIPGTLIGTGGNVDLLADRYYFLITQALEPVIPGAGNYYQWELSGNVAFPNVAGDANCDGNVNVLDVISIVSFITGQNPQPFCPDNADVNNDGNINVLDVIETINIILGGGTFTCGISVVSDSDGNIYNTVLVGNQCWMKENLKTTKYRNGAIIEYPGSNNAVWESNTSGAYAWYNNETGWKEQYGALYNWYAVNNSNGLCPAGWHIPDEVELEQFYTYIGGTGSPHGDQLKSCRQINSPLGGLCNTTEHPRWDYISPAIYGSDDFGYSAFPGGYRYIGGAYESIGIYGLWWSSHEMDPTLAWGFGLLYDHGSVIKGKYNKTYGFSVRCLKN